jgi:tetratricopeptide (TPR) repeat protein
MYGARRLALLLVLPALGLACSRHERDVPPTPCPEVEAPAAVDPALLGFLSAARSAHHVADLREGSGDLAGATQALEALLEGPKPPGERPEVKEVLSDTHARLADLYSRQGKLDLAQRAISEGLELAPGPTYFRGHLFEVRGLLEERQAEALAKAGKADDAKKAKDRALSAFEEAMRIQRTVIEDTAPGRP